MSEYRRSTGRHPVKHRQVKSRLTAALAISAAVAAIGGCGGGGAAVLTGVSVGAGGATSAQPRPVPPVAAVPVRPTATAPVPGLPVPRSSSPADVTRPRAAGAGIVAHGSRARPWVALTFDADMTVGMLNLLRQGVVRSWDNTPLFDELRSTRTPATIFLTGLWTEQYPQVVRQLARDRLFELENHSLDHAGFEAPCYGLPTVGPVAHKRTEIVAARSIIERVAHVRPRYFRFPGGCHTAADVRLVRSLGEVPVQWDVVSGDAFQRDPAVIVRAVIAGVRPGSIVVAHCIGGPNAPATAAAMREIIPALRARGYRFVTVAQLLREAQRRTR